MRRPLTDWTVDYGSGSKPVTVPHAWRQDVPVAWEGPAIYRTIVDLPAGPGFLIFHGVSYAAEVSIDGRLVAEHKGIWDAFSVPVDGGRREIAVEVVKNGGETYPVKDVASGFVPYVFNTFGGIYGAVEFVSGAEDPLANPALTPPTRVQVDGSRIKVAGRPFYIRGMLTWGWYPEIGHTNPNEDTIRREVRQAKDLGFNLFKFCLWVPSHRFLEILREEGVEAWLELPLWDPSPAPDRLEAIAQEMKRIVEQYRRYDNIVVWTVGCELSTATPPEYRKRFVEMVKSHTGCPLVKDNSGGAEMFGGDLREFGDFYDFHPYCDTQFYPTVLDSLLPGPRTSMPVLLGEFNDVDVHRDVARIAREKPYWARDDDEANPQGVRWQFDIPNFIKTCRFVEPEHAVEHETLMRESKAKAVWIRKFVHEAVRARSDIAGYVVTGWRDTPISTAGMIDDWEGSRFQAQAVHPWNGEDVLFLVPTRRPPWVDGGNRPGWLDPFVHFEGPVLWKLGVHTQGGLIGRAQWRIVDDAGMTVASGESEESTVSSLEARQIGELYWADAQPGSYVLEVRFGGARNQWPIWVVPKPNWSELGGWTIHDPARLLDGLVLPHGDDVLATRVPANLAQLLSSGRNVVLFLVDELTQPAPFWRECAQEFCDGAFWTELGFRNRWARLLSVAGDRVIDMPALKERLPEDAKVEILMNRVDVRTYEEAPIMLRARCGAGMLLATTLRPFGGLGVQPSGLERNPAGSALLAGLLKALREA